MSNLATFREAGRVGSGQKKVTHGQLCVHVRPLLFVHYGGLIATEP